jgi:hypothetical protein
VPLEVEARLQSRAGVCNLPRDVPFEFRGANRVESARVETETCGATFRIPRERLRWGCKGFQCEEAANQSFGARSAREVRVKRANRSEGRSANLSERLYQPEKLESERATQSTREALEFQGERLDLRERLEFDRATPSTRENFRIGASDFNQEERSSSSSERLNQQRERLEFKRAAQSKRGKREYERATQSKGEKLKLKRATQSNERSSNLNERLYPREKLELQSTSGELR